MPRFIEFLINHWILSLIWIALLTALLVYQKSKSGKSVSPHQATLLINRADGVVLDLRDKKAFKEGHIVDAINIPLANLKERVVELERHKDKPVITVCQLGTQSGEGVKILEEHGFSSAARMSGGMTEWKTQGLPVVK